MIDNDLVHRAYLMDLLDQESYLEGQVKHLVVLLAETQEQLKLKRQMIVFMQGVLKVPIKESNEEP